MTDSVNRSGRHTAWAGFTYSWPKMQWNWQGKKLMVAKTNLSKYCTHCKLMTKRVI